MGLFSKLFKKKDVKKEVQDKSAEKATVSEVKEPTVTANTADKKFAEQKTTEPKPSNEKVAASKPEPKKDEVKKAEGSKSTPKATQKKNTLSAETDSENTAKQTAKKAPAATKKAEEKQAPVKNEEEETIIAETDVTDSVPIKSKSLSGFFDLKKSKDNRYVFNLYAANKVIIATSQIYSSSQSAINGINSVIANAEKANVEDNTLKNPTPMPFPKWEIYKDKSEQYRFRLSASNGSCICHSQGYTTKANCKKGIESIIRTVKDATIDKSYLKKDQ